MRHKKSYQQTFPKLLFPLNKNPNASGGILYFTYVVLFLTYIMVKAKRTFLCDSKYLFIMGAQTAVFLSIQYTL